MAKKDRSHSPRERATKEGLGEDELALSLQQRAQVTDRLERVGMVAPQSPRTSFARAAIVHLLGFFELVLLSQEEDADVIHG